MSKKGQALGVVELMGSGVVKNRVTVDTDIGEYAAPFG